MFHLPTAKDWPSREGEGLLLRQGTNGWVCLSDDATTPGNDPMCMDSTFHDAVAAFFAGQNSKVTRVGYAYMLTSDAEGSNTDPTARKATPTNQWHHAGPHVMILYPRPEADRGVAHEAERVRAIRDVPRFADRARGAARAERVCAPGIA